MQVEIRPEPYDPWRELSRFQEREDLTPGSYGACATFVGTMRDLNLGDRVSCMELEHYPGMTEKLLEDEARIIVEKHGLLDLLILHRVGQIFPNDPIVLVAAWSAHRAAAFDGCREMMEYLKSRATFWKKESLEQDSQRWVDNVSGS